MPVRRLPHVGDDVTVVFFGTMVSAVIDQIEEDGRRLQVVTEDGELITFALSRATGQFVAEARLTGARLLFRDRP